MPTTASSAPAQIPPSRCPARTRCAATSSIRHEHVGGLSMLLAIDVGNTNTVIGCFEGDKLVESWRIKTDTRATADEFALLLRGLLAEQPRPAGITACSTVPAVQHELRAVFERYYRDVPV